MKTLLSDKFASITSEMGFLECSAEEAAEAYVAWASAVLQPYGMTVMKERVSDTLEPLLLRLLPLTSPICCRYLFIPTASAWTAFFDNGAQGTDAASAMSVLARRIKCRGLRVVSVENTMPSSPKKDSRGRFGATMLEIYGEDGETLRAVYSANDGGKWKFGEIGQRLPFEDAYAYTAKLIRDRFTADMLERYLGHLGITVFDETFYARTGSSLLITKQGKLPRLEEFGLEGEVLRS